MVLQLFLITGELLQIVLPGVHMRYHATRLSDKMIVLLHAMILVIGIQFPILQWIFNLIRSITTDMGSEFDLWRMPDILVAFLARLSKRSLDECRKLILLPSRLFQRAIRQYGWGHMFGNVMKFACQCIDIWPAILQKIRALVSFFRCATWRKHVVDLLSTRLPMLCRLLKSFHSNLAHWRYETSYNVFRDLLKLREPCQLHLHGIHHMFHDFKDRALLLEVSKACNAEWLWIFMAAFQRYVLKPLEYCRRWGLVCPCPEHVEYRRLHPRKPCPCARNSRRLHETREKIDKLVTDMNSWGCTLVMNDCEGSAWALAQVSSCCRKTSGQLDRKSSWRSRVPWTVSEADKPQMAVETMRQLESVEYASLTPLEQDYRDNYMCDFKAGWQSSQQ